MQWDPVNTQWLYLLSAAMLVRKFVYRESAERCKLKGDASVVAKFKEVTSLDRSSNSALVSGQPWLPVRCQHIYVLAKTLTTRI